ncbi:hypothetical protein G6F56_011005 [Rhizopus delemar]|nr:hypothetical protein G6F56_011005 [Rhizopus delemar]
MANQEQIVLATNNNTNSIPGYRPRLIEFYGYEGEDFRHFQEILEFFLAINNISNDSRKLIILKAQLLRAAKIHFERVVLKDYPNVTFSEAMDHLKNHYITPELIQNYELEFNDMQQGEQEHPQIYLARLREAADLANITSEEVVKSRFRAGLLREIKQFCIQSSSKTFKDWINHADGWWNANRPRKIAMVDNPFIPRNVNHALIYQDDINHSAIYVSNQHNVELIDANERQVKYLPVTEIYSNNSSDTRNLFANSYNALPNLTPLEILNRQGSNNKVQQNPNLDNGKQNTQQELLDLIQKAIRNELNVHRGEKYVEIRQICGVFRRKSET